jgi:very-short-patch-repair endonuclease
MATAAQKKAMRQWRSKHPQYHAEWMRRWRANPENRGQERANDKKRRWAREDEREAMNKPKKQTPQQILLAIHLKELGLATIPELMFSERQYRFDLACPEHNLAFEVHGGQYRGGHRTAFWGKEQAAKRMIEGKKETPQEEEWNKINLAQMMGWKVLQFSNQQVEDGRAKAFVESYLKG